MEKKKINWFYITTPILIFAIIVSLLPIRKAIKLLLIPGAPLMMVMDLAFFLLPVVAVAFLIWVAFLIKNMFQKNTKNFLIKTKRIPIILAIIVLVAILGNDLTTYFYELDVSKVGL